MTLFCTQPNANRSRHDPACEQTGRRSNYFARYILGLHFKQIVDLELRWKFPAIHPFRYFVDAGSLMSYGTDLADEFRQSAMYVEKFSRAKSQPTLPVVAADQVRIRNQSQDRQGARPHRAADAAFHRRRGDRITTLFAAVRWSLLAQSGQSLRRNSLAAFGQYRTLSGYAG